MSRQKSPAPEIPGYTFERWINSGGFADVFLYRRRWPNREVAVKALRRTAPEDRARFTDEADLMARLSAHPYIVTIYDAGIAPPPDERPYLVMEFYPQPHFGDRCQPAGLAVEEVLRVGIQVASAVETAHRAGILHRDIKPANILVSEYGKPGLTDFGIAGTREGGDEVAGVSVPFAPPEVLADEEPSGAAADVYSLAVTLHALLDGRSPFEAPGHPNTEQHVVDRVLRGVARPLGRDDVPDELARLLHHAMARRPADRPQTAAELARELQAVERLLHLAPTALEIPADTVADVRRAAEEEDGERTRGRIRVVHPDDPPTLLPGSRPAPGEQPAPQPAPPRPSAGVPARAAAPEPLAPSVVEDTVGRAVPPPDAAVEPRGATPGRARMPLMAGAAAVLVAVAVASAMIAGGGGGDTPSDATSTTVRGGDDPGVGFDALRPPTDVVVEVEMTVGPDGPGPAIATVTFTPVDPQPGDRYGILPQGGAGSPPDPVDQPSATVELSGGPPCVEVFTIRDGRQSERTTACAA